MNRHRRTTRPTIGYITYAVHDDAQFQWDGVVDAAQHYDVNLISFAGGTLTDQDTLWGQSNILYNLATDQNLDGLILWTSTLAKQAYLSESELQTFHRRYGSLPIVSIGTPLEGVPCLRMDSYAGMRDLMTHLIEVHHYRRIAFLRGPADHVAAQERYHIYRDVLTAHDIPVDPQLVSPPLEWTVTTNDVAVALKLLFDERGLRPQYDIEALVVASDSLLFKAVAGLQARGIRIPEEIAVTGFDDMIEGRVSRPPFTTVAVPYYELGFQAVETVLSIIEGKSVPDITHVPTQFVLRQSCGCFDPVVTQIEVSPDAEPAQPIDIALADARSRIVTAMSEALDMAEDYFSDDWAEELFNVFVTAMQTGVSAPFLHACEDLFHQFIVANGNIQSWQSVISAMRRAILPYFSGESLEALHRAETLWQQARVILGEMTMRGQMRQTFDEDQQARSLLTISQTLSTTFDLQELIDTLLRELPHLEIPGAYLSLYQDPQPYCYPQPMPEHSRLLLAYNERGRIDLPAEGQTFPSRQMMPEGLKEFPRQTSLVAMPLHFRREHLGVILFEMGPRKGNIYEVLRGELSSALQGALLVQQVHERSAEIARQKYILDTFIETVPDRIWFKDREGRFTRANRAHALGLGLEDPREEIGKTDADFYGGEVTKTQTSDEQEILRTGQPMLNKEVSSTGPDGSQRWLLVTKMPLLDENQNIIGTFGISRDITALKQAQRELAVAYEEIRIMNDQLQEENLRMGAELNVARRLQEMVLPASDELQQIPGLDIVGYMKPADEVGGDYYDILPEGEAVYIGIGDVTGHGLESGVLMLMVQTTIRALLEHGETDPVKFVNTLNRTIYKNVQRMGADKTLTFALINYANRHLKIVGQHEELLVVRKGGVVERVDTLNLGFPIGLEEEIADWVATATFSLEPEDGVVLYTDGITEAANLRDELYGLDRLCEIISRNWEQSATAIKQVVIDDVTRFIGEQKVYDDLTLVVLKQR